MNGNGKTAAMQTGVVVIIVLAILTALEYWIGSGGIAGATFLLLVIALLKAGAIVQYFMHLPRAFKEGDKH